VLGINTRTPEEEESLHPGSVCSIYDREFYEQIVPYKLGRISAVRQDAAHFCGGKKDIFRAFSLKKRCDGLDVGQVEFLMRSGENILVAAFLESSDDGGAYEATVTGDIDF